MTSGPEPVGTLDVALAHAEKLLASEPRLAAEQAREILGAVPNHPAATLLLGMACRRTGDVADALQHPRTARRLAAALGRRASRTRTGARRCRSRRRGRRGLARGGAPAADDGRRLARPRRPPVRHGRHGRPPTRPTPTTSATRRATRACSSRRWRWPKAASPSPSRCCASTCSSFRPTSPRSACWPRSPRASGATPTPRTCSTRCLELAPSFKAARHNYAIVLHRNNKPVDALAQIDELLAAEPRSPSFRNLKAAVLARIGEYDEAIRLYEQLLREYPRQAKVWLSHGHALKTAGRQDDSIAAYRKSHRTGTAPRRGVLEPREPEDVPLHRGRRRGDARAARAQRPDAGRSLPFPLLAGQGRSRTRRTTRTRSTTTRQATGCARKWCRTTATRSPRTSAAHARCSRPISSRLAAAQGCAAPDPIFVVGLPRSGSTLVEQILSSHSAIEGTMELPDVVGIVKELSGRHRRSEVSKYPEVLESLDAGRVARARRALPAADTRPAQDRLRPTSSTSCRTTGRTSG